MKLIVQTVLGLAFFIAVLFWPAGTFDYWQAWVFLAVFIATTILPSIYLAVRHPDALTRRLKAGPSAETRPAQRIIMTLTVALVVATFVLSSLDHRFGWSQVPMWLVVTGNVLVAAGLSVAQLVVMQNHYAAATVRVEADQPLVSTGLYGLVRHPMYTGAAVMMVGTPLALGSLWGLLGVAASAPVIVARIRDEEQMLTEELTGYPEYRTRVRYRLVPYLW
ncbi:methyltransferase family protein [Mycolicibacterium frederiksbergense]|uniref:Isoprenylcysteine carboxylmethyltransferase family protein n=1 Tax=Mycolicibacterium frederiksbergense TaxID=117567 RepID=A0A6H0S8F8_9MYCO|nr:isoprenylcysteine carboxylmethyltransferase family protein [Mycolicibacterium frederiksbergense]QIV83446.1 isoprenylcysteine carboxylmethyltransferase family protein [Mycolicibacterium frederiksbergense]